MRNIDGAHCQQCGETSSEYIGNLADTEGYTRCCNERVVGGHNSEYNWRTGRMETVPAKCDPRECSHE